MKVTPRISWKFATAAGTFVVLAIIAFSIRTSSAQAQSAPSMPNAPKLAEAVFKNIQVLKGVPADQVVPGMQFISAALGVQCQYCHVEGHFDQDDKKPKQAAREMIKMMFAINKDNFEGHREVTCNTCHRGNVRPMAIPEITDAAMPPHVEEAPPANGPTVDQIFAKYITALGGADAVNKVTSRVQTGTSLIGGYNSPVEIYSKDSTKRISIMKPQGAESITAYDGTGGWTLTTGRPLREMSSSDLDGAKMDADLHFATDIQKEFSDWRVLPGEKVGDVQMIVIRGRMPDKPPIKLYFEEQSGLLARLVRYAETPLGNNPTQIDYSNYRDVDGVKVPFTWTVARPGNRFTINIDKIQQNVPVDDSKFARPSPPPQQ
jgi:photosynthetic reaction center cytochrome c subunit